ncbi:NTP transferase domain-containing protein [Thermus brockianus]|uniref:Acylneuraminate cytidylyltransferase n=1 Tax=Thermus brockianus TaxID=56956 RepID=A0ABM7XLM9_THEBO|nr:NTP transferase domain-containing protein [Thermus brockianus]BDG17264.1 acylneuraminate cytidylyltransferase [Thermus brockianus]
MEAIVLGGGEEAWARKYGVRSKALVPYRGRPLAAWVLSALAEAGLSVLYVGENPGLAPPPRLTLPDQGSLLANLEAALAHVEGRVLVATADIPHLTPEAVRFVLERAPEAALVYPIVPKEEVEARFPRTRRTYARLKEGTFTGGNLLLLDKALFFQALPLAKRVVALRKRPLALARLVGLDILLKLLWGRLSLAEVEARASRILGVEARALVTPYPEVGVDVDREEELVS